MPPQALYIAVMLGIIVVAVILIAPEFQKEIDWYPPCDLYVATYDDQMWWLSLAGVSRKQVPFYRAFSYSGSIIVAHTYEYPSKSKVNELLRSVSPPPELDPSAVIVSSLLRT